MSNRPRFILLVLGVGLLLPVGCRSTRYAIGDFFSPDWMKSQETKDAYAVYTSNGQRYYELASEARADGDAVKALRNFRLAEVQFKKALDFDSYSFKAHLGAGFALLQQETPEKCLEAIDYLEKADDLRSGEWRVHYGLASAYRNLAARTGELLDRLETRKLAAAPADRPAVDAQILAVQAERRGYLENTLKEAHRLLDVAPEQHQAFLLIGTASAGLQRYDEAITNLERWLTLARQTREVYEKWQREGVLPRGVTGSSEELEKKIRANRIRDAEAKDLLASVYKARGEYPKALEQLNAIYEANPSAPPRYLPARAWIKAKLGDYPGAVADLDRFLKALGRSGRDYDEVVRRAMEQRDSYLTMLRERPDAPPPAAEKQP
jgi:tetratricopeptide (TPR) repeat protein